MAPGKNSTSISKTLQYIKNITFTFPFRTHSLIIIDSDNRVDFHEWTLQEPIDINNPKWIESKYEFILPMSPAKL